MPSNKASPKTVFGALNENSKPLSVKIHFKLPTPNLLLAYVPDEGL